MKTYILKPDLTFTILSTPADAHKTGHRAQDRARELETDALVTAIAPAPPALKGDPDLARACATTPASVPPHQPLPVAVIDPNKPMLKLGLDVHLEFIMAVAQKDHAAPQAPRKFSNAQLVEQVRQWVAAGLQVFCVEESCGFGFVLHRELVAAGAQSFLITPVSLNGKRKTDKLDARALCPMSLAFGRSRSSCR